MSGRSPPSKTASMTTPVTCSTRPTLRARAAPVSSFRVCVVASKGCSSVSAEPLGPGNDFHDLLGDVRLALAVHLERVVLDQLRRVLRRVAHRGHARTVLRRRRLQQCAENADLDVVRDEPAKDLLRLRLVEPERSGLGPRFGPAPLRNGVLA